LHCHPLRPLGSTTLHACASVRLGAPRTRWGSRSGRWAAALRSRSPAAHRSLARPRGESARRSASR